MNFTKGVAVGMIAGTIVGVMNKESIINALNTTIKDAKKMKKKYRL